MTDQLIIEVELDHQIKAIETLQVAAIRAYFKQQGFQMPADWAQPYVRWKLMMEQGVQETSLMGFEVQHVEVDDMLKAWQMYCEVAPLESVREAVLGEWLKREELAHIPASFAMQFARWAYRQEYVLLEVGKEWMIKRWSLLEMHDDPTP